MKASIFTKLSFQVVFIFATIILASWIPDLFPKFFGDWQCRGYSHESPFCLSFQSSHNPKWHWGARHYLWALMGLVLFIIQCVRLGNLISDSEKKQ